MAQLFLSFSNQLHPQLGQENEHPGLPFPPRKEKRVSMRPAGAHTQRKTPTTGYIMTLQRASKILNIRGALLSGAAQCPHYF